MEKYSVYVKTDDAGNIIAVNSNIFQHDLDGWTKIDEGEGVKFLHAQGNYFPKDIRTELGVYRYKLADGSVQELTDAEIGGLEEAIIATIYPQRSQEERISDLEEALTLLLSGVTE